MMTKIKTRKWINLKITILIKLEMKLINKIKKKMIKIYYLHNNNNNNLKKKKSIIIQITIKFMIQKDSHFVSFIESVMLLINEWIYKYFIYIISTLIY